MTSDTLPVVTVVIPNYNCGRYILETLESATKKQNIPLEVIIVDDASTDNTRDILAEISPIRRQIKTIFLERNHGGPSKPRNVGLEAARGKYVCFIDADDLLLPNILSEAVAFHEMHPGLGFVFFDALKFNDAQGIYPETFLSGHSYFRGIEKIRVRPDGFLINGNRAHEALFHENYVLTPGVVTIRREIFRHIGTFDEELTNADDWDMWFRITKIYDVGFIDKVGFHYRVRSGSISFRGAKLAENRIRVIKKHLEAKDLPESVRNSAFRLIAENLYGVGYQFQSSGNMSEARKQYLKSLRESASWPATKGLLLTLLGRNVYAKLKKIRTDQPGHP